MIPLMMKIHIHEKGKKSIRLFIPLFLVWIVLFLLLIILLPFFMIAAIIAWPMGCGRIILAVIPMLFSVIWAMSGLKVQIKNRDKCVYLNVR